MLPLNRKFARLKDDFCTHRTVLDLRWVFSPLTGLIVQKYIIIQISKYRWIIAEWLPHTSRYKRLSKPLRSLQQADRIKHDLDTTISTRNYTKETKRLIDFDFA